MARRRPSRAQRDASDIASTDLGLLRPTLPSRPLAVSEPPELIEDRRFFNFEPAVPLASPGVRSRVRMAPVGPAKPRRPGRPSFRPDVWSFGSPDQVAVCVRRKVRREVLHALRRTRGGGARRRSRFSNIRC